MPLAIDGASLSLAQRIGGKWALSQYKWLITLLLLPLLAAGYTRNIQEAHNAVLWASFSLGGLCVVGCIDYTLHRTLFRNRVVQPVPMWWVIVNSVFGGLLIGFAAWFGDSLGGEPDFSQMAVRIPALGVLGGVWGVFLTLVLEYRERANAMRQMYVDEMVQIELLKAQQSVIVDEIIQAVRHETLREIAKIRAVVAELHSGPTGEASAVLRTSAADAIGPLSKKLWNSAKDSYPKIRLRDVIVHAIRTQPFRPLALSVLVVCLSVMDRVARLGTQTGLLMTALIVFVVASELLIANSLMERWNQIRSRIFVCTLIVVELETIGMVVWERHLMNAAVSYAEIVVSVSASVFLFFISIGLRSVDLMRGEIASFVMSDIREEKIASIARDRQISSVVREMARELHGTVQTRLVSCALALDMAAEAGDSESANAALLEARRILDPTVSERVEAKLSVSSEVQRKVSVWKSLCDVSVEIDVFREDVVCARRIGRVVEEGITNAVRHGGASEINVVVTQINDEVVRVVVSDNGRGPTGGSSGLGSSILDGASDGAWSLNAGARGAVLSVSVRCGSAV